MRKYIFPVLIIILALGLTISRYNPSNKMASSDQKETINTTKATLLIDFGDSNLKTFDLTMTSEDTAFSVLKNIAEKENINLETVQYDFGVFVKKIGEFESTAKKSWIYYVNGESGQIAADQYKLKNRDKVLWKYEAPKI